MKKIIKKQQALELVNNILTSREIEHTSYIQEMGDTFSIVITIEPDAYGMVMSQEAEITEKDVTNSVASIINQINRDNR